MSNQPTLLLVDDELELLELYKTALTEAGFHIFTAQNGQDAINATQEKIPDLILMDVRMPNMNGFEAASAIKNNPKTKDVKIAFITGFGEQVLTGVEEKLAKEFATNDYIKKGMALEDLVAVIKRLLP